MCQFSNFRDLVQRSRPQGFVKRRSGASVKIRTLYHPTSRAWPRLPHAMLWIVDRNFRHTWRSQLLVIISGRLRDPPLSQTKTPVPRPDLADAVALGRSAVSLRASNQVAATFNENFT